MPRQSQTIAGVRFLSHLFWRTTQSPYPFAKLRHSAYLPYSLPRHPKRGPARLFTFVMKSTMGFFLYVAALGFVLIGFYSYFAAIGDVPGVNEQWSGWRWAISRLSAPESHAF